MSPSGFLPDTPITSPDKDRLGRRAFSERLAAALKDWRHEDSIVIALFGSWGSGKTSIIEMALHVLEEHGKDAGPNKAGPVVVRFNPWHFTDQEQLLSIFLHELMRAITEAVPEMKATLGNRLSELGNYLSSSKPAAVMALLENLPGLGDWVKAPATALKTMAEGQGLAERRKDIDAAFRELKRRVIIVMDDVDRLPPAQIRDLFQIVKLNANFPNTVYLIAADRTVVEKSLSTEQGISGRTYVEKIIQAAFDVPMPDASRITMVLDLELGQILASVPESDWDQNAWSNLYQSGFRDLFANLRDVKRFSSSLSFTFPVIKNELNPVDFIGLEALRVFVPDIYGEIGSHKTLLLGLWDITDAREHMRTGVNAADAAKEELERILQLGGPRQRAVRGVVGHLFPATLQIAVGAPVSKGYEDTWRQQRRICSQELFDRYFLLGTPTADISRAELAGIAAAAETLESLITLLTKYQQDGRFPRLTDWLPDVIPLLSNAAVLGFCDALLTVIDEFPDERFASAFWGMTPRLSYVIREALRRIEKGDCCEWVRQQILSGRRLYALINQVAREEPSKGRRPLDAPWSEECQAELKEACLDQLRKIVIPGRPLPIKNPLGILVTWKRWTSDAAEVDSYVASVTSDPQKALAFVVECLYEVHVTPTPPDRKSADWSLNLDNLAELTDLDVLEQVLAQVERQITPLSERQQKALDIFKAEMKMHRARSARPGDM